MDQDPEKNDIVVCVESRPIAVRSENELALLPEKEFISTEDDKFYDEAVKLLPAEIQNEVKAQALSQKIKYSRWEILLCIVIIAVLCTIAYSIIFPDVKPVKISTIVPMTEIKVKQEASLYEKMKALFEDKQYQACIDCLSEEQLQQILGDKKKLRQNTYVLTLYLNSIFMLNCTPEEKEKLVARAREICRKLLEYNPDYPDWIVHKLRFDNHYIVSGWGASTLRTINTAVKNQEEQKRLLAEIEYMERIKTDNFMPNLLEVFDMAKSKIYIAYWLHCLAFDNYHDVTADNNNGLWQRVSAYDICKKYENSLEFLDLREFILGKILSRKYWQDYYFDGKGDIWLDDVLEEEFKTVRERKASLQALEK